MRISNELIQRISREDMAVLAELDSQGLICASNEDALEFASRLRSFDRNMAKMQKEIQERGAYVLEGISVTPENRISQSFFEDAGEITRKLYDFDCRWVPGYFLTQSLGILFGGCALTYYPDFFALFIVRKAFKNKEKWLFYSRNELLSHELCHVARLGLESKIYEETMAYATSASAFRRLSGGIFHDQKDVYSFLAATLLLLAGQVARTFALPDMPIWPFWLLLAAVFAFLVLRHIWNFKTLKRARCALSWLFPADKIQFVLFRCTDSEIAELAALNKNNASEWLRKKKASILRWKIISHKYQVQNE